MDTREILEKVRDGNMAVEEAEQGFRRQPFEEMGYAKLDFHRKLRTGFGETVFCQGKPDEYLIEIYQRIYERDGEVLGTRATKEQYELVKRRISQVVYDPVSRILKIPPSSPLPSDIPCAIITPATAPNESR